MLIIVILVVCFIVVAMMWPEGVWSNAITFINAVFSGLVAWNYFEPFADFIQENADSFTYVADFLSFWVLFAAAFNIFRVVTDQTSKTKARFRRPVDMAGSGIFAVLTALLMTSLIITSLHFAPLGKTPFRGSFGKGPEASTFLGMQIENFWLNTMGRLSKKVPHPEKPGEEKGAGPLATSGTNHFDPDHKFKAIYATRRANLENHNNEKGRVRVTGGR